MTSNSKNKVLINRILLIFKLHVYQSRGKQFMNTNNLIGEIKPLKNIEKEVATSNPKKQ